MSEDIKKRFSVFIKTVLMNERNNYLKKINRIKDEALSTLLERESVLEALIHRDTHGFIEKDIINCLLSNLKDTDREKWSCVLSANTANVRCLRCLTSKKRPCVKNYIERNNG